MQINTRSPMPARGPVTFECAGCEAKENRGIAILPIGWDVATLSGVQCAFCPDCAPRVTGAAAEECELEHGLEHELAGIERDFADARSFARSLFAGSIVLALPLLAITLGAQFLRLAPLA